jgi:tRNA-dihydrouridine synthase
MGIIETVRSSISIPLTVKIRIQGNEQDLALAQLIQDAGADAVIVHGRRWVDDYAIACDLQQIGLIKKAVSIPVIANGDIRDNHSLQQAQDLSACDAFMIGRAGCGRPWLYEELLEQKVMSLQLSDKMRVFLQHLHDLAALEDEYKAVLQSKSLVRYYFRGELSRELLEQFYSLESIEQIREFFK